MTAARPAPAVLATASSSAWREVYAAGGAAAIGALAAAPPRSPRSPWSSARGAPGCRRPSARSPAVGIDGLAGPSEVMVIADAGADPAAMALDLLAQAEHGPRLAGRAGERRRVVDAVAAALEGLPEAIGPITLVECASMPLAIELAEAFAPEHLEVATRDPQAIVSDITRAGAVFVGPNCATAFGDYVAGSNHVLPTGGAARHASALGPTVPAEDVGGRDDRRGGRGADATPGGAGRRGLPDAPPTRPRRGASVNRSAEVRRATRETDVRVRVELDQLGDVGRLDRRRVPRAHLLTLLARPVGSTWRSPPPRTSRPAPTTRPDVGITLGQALAKALGDRAGIERHGSGGRAHGRVSRPGGDRRVGRPYAAVDVPLPDMVIGGLEPKTLPELLRELANHAGLTLHVRLLAEAAPTAMENVKAVAKALAIAVAPNPRVAGIPSTKGTI